MTTTTATTTTTTAKPTTTNAVQTATKTLLTSLGTGSGVDTAGLVDSLVQAQFAARTAQLTAKADKLTAQISGISTLKSTITGFASALDNLAKSGSLRSQPKSSNPAVLTATASGLGLSSALTATVRVDRLASAQSTASPQVMKGGVAADRSTVLGSGKFTLSLGPIDYITDDKGVSRIGPVPAGRSSISFDLTDASVNAIADAINKEGKALGISASIVTGAKGETFLSIKGPSGSDNVVTLATDGDAALKQFDIGEGTAVTAKAQNAQLVVDGVPVERASNSVGDLFPGVKLELTGIGATQMSATRPTEGLTQAADDFVATYNEVLATITEQTNAKTGKLFGDPAAQLLLKQLKQVTLAALNPSATGGAPKTLAEIGIRTQRDGTLSIDKTQLARTVAEQPDGVEAMFRASTLSTTGLPALLQSIATAATSAKTGLGASTARYTDAQGAIDIAKEKLAGEGEAMTTRLTAQFTAMNTRVSAYKATQSFLTNQIAAWNRSDS